MANILAIVGRPNVGKSTLFNRLVEQRQAITDNMSGVTRDRHYGYGEWNGFTFTVIDTGGYVDDSDDMFEKEIKKQVKEALQEATVILFMVDCQTGLHDLDKDFANILRELHKPIIVVTNKADNQKYLHASNEFYEMGLNASICPIAAISGSGTGDLLDETVNHFQKNEEINKKTIPRIAILGKPNVGKSSFVNALIGKKQNIVTPIAGTTRDAIDTHYNLFGKNFILTDTAGIRKKSKVNENIEFYSVMRAIQAMQKSDVCIIMIDANSGVEAQDMNIIALTHKYKKGMLLMINKWDLISKNQQTAEIITKSIKEKLGLMTYIPIIFTAVTQKQRIMQSIELATKIFENRAKRIATSKLNEILLKEIIKYPPPAVRGQYIKIKYITQLPTPTPTFAFFCNTPKYIKEPYQRYLINKIREHFDFSGVPIKAVFRQK